MKKRNIFYGEHFEALGDIWSAIYGNVETFLKNYLKKYKRRWAWLDTSTQKGIICHSSLSKKEKLNIIFNFQTI